ncbi:hypothetical protein [Streptomyces sp. DSM 40484]|uniref:hypothetical protein n=1 Tax=Streptomyces kroppenstedtii TaxID=3051181 RepID=UPI0028D3229F|nr:hypothetical protein [Streptomyces sp. DSM 40484]
MSPLFISTMRTVVPLVVGWLLSLAAWAGFSVGSEQAAGAVTIALALAYYALFRVLEAVGVKARGIRLQKLAGFFLGWARPPAYPGSGGALPPVTGMYGGQTRAG